MTNPPPRLIEQLNTLLCHRIRRTRGRADEHVKAAEKITSQAIVLLLPMVLVMGIFFCPLANMMADAGGYIQYTTASWLPAGMECDSAIRHSLGHHWWYPFLRVPSRPHGKGLGTVSMGLLYSCPFLYDVLGRIRHGIIISSSP